MYNEFESRTRKIVQLGFEGWLYIRTIREFLRHKDVKTTMIYTHVLNRGGKGVRSPADTLREESNRCYTETI